MNSSLSHSCQPAALSMLHHLIHILHKGQESAAQRQFDPAILVQSRLAPDMFALSRQVQIACDIVKNGISRIAGIEPPKFDDTETTFEQLIDRIQKTIAFISTIEASQMDGKEDTIITFPAGKDKTMTMNALAYVHQWILPNLYFHITTTYAILRHNGVNLGKIDYLMGDKR
jgi:uncharacterized protein